MQNNKYLPFLQQIVYREMGSIQYDINNGSNIFVLQAACTRMFNVMAYMAQYMLEEATINGHLAPVVPVAAPRPAPMPQPMAHIPLTAPMPFAPPFAQTAQSSPVMEVSLTPEGTRVLTPGSTSPLVLPPGSPVVLPGTSPSHHVAEAHAHGGIVDVFPQGARPQGDNNPAEINLPQGGGFTPEVQQALQAARNITNDPIPE